MFGLKLVRGDLQAELLRQVNAAGFAHTVDPQGFIVVGSDDDIGVLENLAFEIATRVVGATSSRDVWHFGGPLASCDEKKKLNQSRGVPFVEYETIGDRFQPRLPRQPAVVQLYCLVIRNESSLPKGQRPWDRT